MGSLHDDLNKYLKTDGVRILMDYEGVKIEPNRYVCVFFLFSLSFFQKW